MCSEGQAVFYILCGLPFAGKSTFARAMSDATSIDVISLDEINDERGLFGGDGVAVEEWERTSGIACERAFEKLSGGHSVILDDTTCLRFLRDRYREVAVRAQAEALVIYIDTAESEIQRRRQRNLAFPERRDVADEVYDATAARFEAPGEDEDYVVYRGEEVREWTRLLLDL